MIKVEIKPVYATDGSSMAQARVSTIVPEYLEKTIKILGVTVFTKEITPTKKGDGYEYLFI